MSSFSSTTSDSACILPPELREVCDQYCRHSFSVRSVASDTVAEELLYLKRFLLYLVPRRRHLACLPVSTLKHSPLFCLTMPAHTVPVRVVGCSLAYALFCVLHTTAHI